AIKDSSDSLQVSFVGYKAIIVESKPGVIIPLTPNSSQLQSIIVTANREAGLRTQSPIAISKLSATLIDETKASMAFELVNKT
ncbi:hypothetical protein ACEV93_25080, partial [Vibrio parahaemolyticus]